MFQEARSFFAKRQVLEVDCGALVPFAPISANIDVIAAPPSDTESGYLHTSPEYAMKRLLSQGLGDIYFLGHVYRKGEKGHLHSPEFTMAEWYRIGFTFEEMIQETCEFLFLFLGELPISQISYREAFHRYVGVDYSQASLEELRQIAGPHLPADTSLWTRDTYIHLLLTHFIEPHLGQGELTILRDYPPHEAALACVVERNGEKVAERFEIYYRGVELSNGYHELANAEELRARFHEENRSRKIMGKETYLLDEDFLSSLATFPDCCGVSVGFDRALMLKHKLSSIHAILP
jgi:lysyl-tRNA synthetase class 2